MNQNFYKVKQQILYYEIKTAQDLQSLVTNQMKKELEHISKSIYHDLNNKNLLTDESSILCSLPEDIQTRLTYQTFHALQLPGIVEFLSFWKVNIAKDCYFNLEEMKKRRKIFSVTKNLNCFPSNGNHVMIELDHKQFIKGMLISDTYARMNDELRRKLLSNERIGNCHDMALKIACYIHGSTHTGIIILPHEYFVHSVVEKDGYILDSAENLVIKKEDYIKFFNFHIINTIPEVDYHLLEEAYNSEHWILYQKMLDKISTNGIPIPKPLSLSKKMKK